MVAYSFQPRFRPAILAGTKQRTIRGLRKRHARVGEDLQLYTGMRTQACDLMGTAVCTAIDPIRIGIADNYVETERTGRFYAAQALDDFARLDGFANWSELHEFWRRTHATERSFEGVLIQWTALQPSARQ